MHVVTDENGNPIPHGAGEHNHDHHHEHEHSHEHEHGHSHEHESRAQEECKKDPTTALLTYMIDHNEHHAAEIVDMAADIESKGKAEAAAKMKEAVDEFNKGNALLREALELYKA